MDKEREKIHNQRKTNKRNKDKIEKQTKHNIDLVVNGLRVFKITRKAFHHYRYLVKDNSKISYLTARKKLTRNILLGWKEGEFEKPVKTMRGGLIKNFSIYDYGSLRIILSGHTIVHVEKLDAPNENFIYHSRKAEKISKRLELKFDR